MPVRLGTARHGLKQQFHFPFYRPSNTPSPSHRDSFLSILRLSSSFLAAMSSKRCPEYAVLFTITVANPNFARSGFPSFLALEFWSGPHRSMTHYERFGRSAFSPTYPERTVRWGVLWGGGGGTYRVGELYMHCLRLGSPVHFET